MQDNAVVMISIVVLVNFSKGIEKYNMCFIPSQLSQEALKIFYSIGTG